MRLSKLLLSSVINQKPRTPRIMPKPNSLPLKDQKEFEESVRAFNQSTDAHPDAPSLKLDEFSGEKNPASGEIGGPKGKERNRLLIISHQVWRLGTEWTGV